MKKNKIVYKVVNKDKNGKYASYFASAVGAEKDSCMLLNYGVGETTVPIHGKIFVFKRLQDAIAYGCNASKVIIKGTATDIEECSLTRLLNMSGHTNKLIKDFWDNTTCVPSQYRTWPVPSKTYLCSSFTGIEIVKEPRG